MPTINRKSNHPWIVPSVPFERAERSDIYTTARWQQLRKLKLQQQPLCEQCQRRGIIKEGRIVDHIISMQDGGNAWDFNNLQTLCNYCHSKKTANEIERRKFGVHDDLGRPL